jgi:hypothetical protein
MLIVGHAPSFALGAQQYMAVVKAKAFFHTEGRKNWKPKNRAHILFAHSKLFFTFTKFYDYDINGINLSAGTRERCQA